MVDALPPTLRAAVRAEFDRAFHDPWEAPIVVAVNGLLMAGAWFFLPLPLQDVLFRLHGALAFPCVLASWMLADVPATNVLGGDAERIGAALDDPKALRRLLHAKNIVLWSITAPIAAVIALGVGLGQDRWVATLVTIVGILVVPVGSLGVAAWVGVCFPYHPLPLAERWSRRREWKPMLLRWGILVSLPYVVVPLLTTALVTPALAGWVFVTDDWQRHISDLYLTIGLVLTAALSAAMFAFGHRTSLWLVRRRHDHLARFLADPRRG